MRTAFMLAVLASAAFVVPAAAQQQETINLRVDKLEKEMRAVQRKVFPGGAGLQPEIGPAGATPAGTPATTAVTDLTARVDALEAQLKSLTGQVEQDGFRIRKLEDAVKALSEQVKAQAAPIGDAPAPEAKPMAQPSDEPVVAKPVQTAAIKPVATATPKPAPASAVKKPATPATAASATPVSKDPKRKALVDAIEVPSTGDAAEDSYTYGYRLWSAKLYPEAQVKLKEFVAKYATHKRASYAQNLLGRAYMDEGKPALAAVAFYDSYQKWPRGDRASESLWRLGVALTALKKNPDACKVYKEFDDVYGASASADLKSKVAQGRTDAKCTA